MERIPQAHYEEVAALLWRDISPWTPLFYVNRELRLRSWSREVLSFIYKTWALSLL